jgi:hypothetical protein
VESLLRMLCIFEMVIYATSFCVNWAFLIAQGPRYARVLSIIPEAKNGFAFAFDSFDKFFKTCQKCDVQCVV